MPNELSEKVYPDGTVVKLRDDTAREQINNLKAVETYSGNLNYSGRYEAYKCGRIVTLKISGVVNPTTGQRMVLTESLPAAIRPMSDINVIGMYSYGTFDASNESVNFRIEAGGIIWTYSNQPFTSGNVNITYVSAS